MLVIKWAYRYYSLTAEFCVDLDEAVRAAVWASDAGEESIHSIEVIDSDGSSVVYDSEAVNTLMKPIEDERMAQWKAEPTPAAILDIRGPNGEWATFGSFVDDTAADEKAEEIRAALGADRVRLRPYSQLAS